jgi:hypothetical protein
MLTEDLRPTTEDRGTLPRGLRRVIHRDRLGGGWVVELVFGLGGHVGVSAMSDRGARATGSVVALEPKANVRPEAGDPLEKAGHLILDMVGKAASAAEVNYQQVVEASRKLSGQLRGPKIGYESLR